MVVREELVEEDKQVPQDQRSMEQIRKMGDSILPMIQLEDDCPSKTLTPSLGRQERV